MRVTTISYGRKFNIGNYETEDIHITAELDSTETLDVAFTKLRAAALISYKRAKEASQEAYDKGQADRLAKEQERAAGQHQS